MKNVFKLFVPMAAAVIATVACSREEFVREEVPALKITVKAAPDEVKTEEPGVKSYIDGTTIKWGTGEYMKIGVNDGTAVVWGNSADATADLWDGDTQALFSFEITPATASGEYTYYGLYPASAAVESSNTDAAQYKVDLPATQRATASSYDPKAYILVARPESGKTAASSDWEAWFRRATALNKITLKNLPEDIKRVTITAPAGTDLAGRRYFNLSTGESGALYFGQTNTIDVRYSTKLAGGANMDIWFTSWGADIDEGSELTVAAYSSAHIYTRAITAKAGGIHFKEAYLNTLSINMTSADVTDNPELEEGNYVVLAKDGTNYYALKAEKESGKERLLSVAYTGSLSSYSGDEDIIWNVTASDDSYIFANTSKYLGYKGSSNESYWLAAAEDWTTDNYLLDVTPQATAGQYYVTPHANNNRYLSKNNSGAFFAFYGNTNQKADIVFVPATPDTRTAVTLSFAESTVNKTSANYNEFTGQEATASPNVSAITNAITYAISGDAIGTVTEATGAVSLNGTLGTATVTATFAGDENYRPAQASYTINVESSTPTYDFETVAELNALLTSTSSTYKGYLTDAVVSFVPATNTAIVKDATGSVMFYKSGHGLLQGQTFTGVINVTAVKYNNLYSEITVWDASFSGSETAVAPESVSLANLIGHYNDYQNAYVSVAGLTVESVSGKNINVTDGTNTYVVYYNPGSATCGAGDVITAVGTITKYQTTEEIKVWAAGGITVTGSAPKAITFSQPAAGGSFTVSVGGTPITSGDTVASGTTVTLTATPAENYVFSSWTVTGATVADASAATTTFTMGTSAVSVSASFSSTGGGGGQQETPTSVVYDFTGDDWSVSDGTLTDGTVSFTGAGGANFKMNSGYFIMGKTNAYLTFPTYSYAVTKIEITGNSGASGSVVQNIYVGNTAVSTATTGATGKNTYNIDSNYQSAGTTYVLKVTSNHNTQITKIEVFF